MQTQRPSKRQSIRPAIAFYGFRGGAGGLSNVMLNLINAIALGGQAVDMVLHNDDIPELARLEPSINIVRLGGEGVLVRTLRLRRYLQQRRPAVLLSNREPANRVAVLARWLSAAPVRVVFRVGTSMEAAIVRRGFVKGWLRRLSILVCYRYADLVIANAQAVAREVSEVAGLPLNEIRVLDNPTLPADLANRASLPVAHPWLQSDAPPVVMGVGRLIGTKGFDLLIRAFARVRQVVDCRLIILGEGKERRSLLALAGEVGVAESVDLPGHVANPYAWISRARLFVLASRWEGSPNVVIEALGLGVPVVSTDCPGGVRELLQDGRCGTLVALDDEAMLAQAIQEGLLAKVDKQALVNSVRKFDAAISAQTYLEALRVNPL